MISCWPPDPPDQAVRYRLGEGAIGAAAQRRAGLVVNDYRNWPSAHPLVLAQTDITAVIAEPLICHDRLVGVLGVDNSGTGQVFTEQDREIIALFGAEAAIAIENARLYAQLTAQRETLRALSARIMAAREEEAKRIARELHDELGQSMTSVLLGFKGLEGVEDVREIRRRLADLSALITKNMEEIHRLIRDLRPASLDRFGLVLALEQHAKTYGTATGLRIDFCAPGLETAHFSPEVTTAVFRIAQEALTNIVKHAQAQMASVMLTHRGGKLVLIIEDDGKGFDFAEARRRRSGGQQLGLVGMEERVQVLGGTLTMESSPGSGTTLVMELPYEA